MKYHSRIYKHITSMPNFQTPRQNICTRITTCQRQKNARRVSLSIHCIFCFLNLVCTISSVKTVTLKRGLELRLRLRCLIPMNYVQQLINMYLEKLETFTKPQRCSNWLVQVLVLHDTSGQLPWKTTEQIGGTF